MLRPTLIIATIATAAACSNEADLSVYFLLGGDPVIGAEVVALPFDPGAILDSLATNSDDPAPSFEALETALFAFEASDDSALAAINRPWQALRDSVADLSETLQAMDRTDPAYAVAYEAFRVLYAQFTRRTAERGRAVTDLDGNAVALARWAQAAADTLRTWERSVFGPYDSLAATSLMRTGRDAHAIPLDVDGQAHLELEPGAWWLIVRVADTDNPFLEYYWNVPVIVNGLVPTVLTADERHAQHRWRH